MRSSLFYNSKFLGDAQQTRLDYKARAHNKSEPSHISPQQLGASATCYNLIEQRHAVGPAVRDAVGGEPVSPAVPPADGRLMTGP